MLRIWDSKAAESHSSRIMCKGKDHLKNWGQCISLNLPLPLRTNPSPLTGLWHALVLSRSAITSCFPLSLFVGLRSHAHTFQIHRYFWFFPFGRHLCFFFPSLKFSFPAHCMTKGLHWTKMYILKRALSLGGLFLPPFIDWSCPLQHIGLCFLSIIYYTCSVASSVMSISLYQGFLVLFWWIELKYELRTEAGSCDSLKNGRNLQGKEPSTLIVGAVFLWGTENRNERPKGRWGEQTWDSA